MLRRSSTRRRVVDNQVRLPYIHMYLRFFKILFSVAFLHSPMLMPLTRKWYFPSLPFYKCKMTYASFSQQWEFRLSRRRTLTRPHWSITLQWTKNTHMAIKVRDIRGDIHNPRRSVWKVWILYPKWQYGFGWHVRQTRWRISWGGICYTCHTSYTRSRWSNFWPGWSINYQSTHYEFEVINGIAYHVRSSGIYAREGEQTSNIGWRDISYRDAMDDTRGDYISFDCICAGAISEKILWAAEILVMK